MSLRIAVAVVTLGVVHTSAQAPGRTAARFLPGTRSNLMTKIQGNALNSSNGSLPNVLVRLRDARLGQIVDSQVSDKSGLFAFKAVDPGSYIVEIIGNDQTVLAASQILSVNAGDAVSAVVKLPFRIPPFAGLLGTSSTPTAAAVATEAAASSVLAVTATKESSSQVSQNPPPAIR